MKEYYTTAIIDDDQVSINNLVESLKNVDHLKIIGWAKNGLSGKEMILKSKPDLIFLDIEMPDMSGFELLKDIREIITWPMQVIFYTAYDSYLLKAIRESAFDYLLKPYTNCEFLIVINHFFKHISTSIKQYDFKSAVDDFSLLPSDSPFLITTIKGYRVAKANEIGFFEYEKSKKRWSAIFESKLIPLKRNTSASEILMLAPVFAQINQQQIINISYLEAIEGKECILYPPFNKHKSLTISRNYYDSIQDKFMSI